ncbi:MAG: NmrA family NAD(P)-binding protein [Leptospiraceae bacterium]|nr:NmrA family NAD(P)-binding protein [Leptospiraceae bacterium]
MEKILVTGATGVIGSYVLEKLIQKGNRPIAGVRDTKKLNRKLQEHSEVLYLDYNEITSIDNALSGVDKIFLVPPMEIDMVNMMKNILSKTKNISHIVSISVSGADPKSEFPLLRWHGEIKNLLIEANIPFTLIAPSHFYQNYIEFCAESIQNEDTFYFSQGDTKKSMIDTVDIAEVAVKALLEEGHAGNTYYLSGHDYDNIEIAEFFTKTLGRKINYIDIDPTDYRGFLKKMNMPEWKIELFLKLNAAWKAGSRLKSNEETKRLLGREPRTFLEFLTENKNS